MRDEIWTLNTGGASYLEPGNESQVEEGQEEEEGVEDDPVHTVGLVERMILGEDQRHQAKPPSIL